MGSLDTDDSTTRPSRGERRVLKTDREAKKSAYGSVALIVFGWIALVVIVLESYVLIATGFYTIRDPFYRRSVVAYGSLEAIAVSVGIAQLSDPTRWRRALFVGALLLSIVSAVAAPWVLLAMARI